MEVVIEAGRTYKQYWTDLWRYRELFYFLAWRDVLIRYKQTLVGVMWAVIRPLLTMIVLTLVFGGLAGMPSGNVPYPILVFCAMLPWQFFSTAVSECGNSLVSNSSLISKVYFPRMTIPSSSVIANLLDFAICALLLAVLMLVYQYVPGPRVLLLPAFIVLMTATNLGVGLCIAAAMVQYRDFRFIVPFIVQFGLYISPVGYSSDVVPDEWRLLYSLNPMVGVIDGFRWAILGGDTGFYWREFLMSVIVSCGLLWSGVRYFRHAERTFADVV